MDINKHLKVFIPTKLLLQLLTDNFNLEGSVPVALWILISKKVSVHVLALQVASVVACNHSVRVYDWDYPGFEQFSELMTD